MQINNYIKLSTKVQKNTLRDRIYANQLTFS